jgi:hypothetical protein
MSSPAAAIGAKVSFKSQASIPLSTQNGTSIRRSLLLNNDACRNVLKLFEPVAERIQCFQKLGPSWRWSIRPKFMLISIRWRANRLGGGIRREIILHQVGPLIDNGVRAFQSSIVKTLMVIHIL